MKKIENYIHGKTVSKSKKIIPVFDPSIGEKSGEVVLSNKDDF